MQVFVTVLRAILGMAAFGFTIPLWTTRVPPLVRATVIDDLFAEARRGRGDATEPQLCLSRWVLFQ
ncbi:MAG: hypothetical protein HWD91_10825 [Marivivens sp.]|uniref:hypothetical protein n=1 Tax=Marivivens sp. TaxID=1978374 RepID=UPI0017F5F92F|nr:hypothetical protein [Marivivens sp.]NVJ96071.1 hypothetical protein [Marivivens sp.]